VDKNIQRIFREFDSSEHLERPHDFDCSLLKKRISDCHVSLESILKKDLALEDKIEDASFYGDIILLERKVNNIICKYAVRFSNFGFMATITMSGYENEDKVIDVIKQSGFIYIPHEVLDVEYDGLYGDRDTVATWGIRFFDYL